MKRFSIILSSVIAVCILAYSLGAVDITKRLIGKQDIQYWDGGATDTFTGLTSTGRTITLSDIDWMGVDVEQVFGARNQASLTAALAAIGTTRKARMWLAPGEWALESNTTITSNITLSPAPGCTVTVGSYTFTVNGPIDADDFKWLTLGASSSFVYNGPTPLNALWAADGDGTDDWQALQILLTSIHHGGGTLEFPYTPSGYGLSKALVIPETAVSSGINPENFVIRGRGSKAPKLITLGAVSAIETYDVTVVEPAKWMYGLMIENLELDGNGVGVNGLDLHGLARQSAVRDLYIHEFTNAAILASRWIESTIENVYAWGNFTDTTLSKYGLYHVDGTTTKVIGSTFNAFQTGYHADGNLTEAASGNDDGPDSMTMIGTVFEDCGQYGINIEAGAYLKFISVHVEDIGDTYGSTAYGIKVDNEGGQTPREIIFDMGTITVDNADSDEAFYIDYCNKVYFNKTSNAQLSGGLITSNAAYVKMENGAWTNDFRITNDLTLTAYTHDGGNGAATLSVSTGDFVNDGVTTRMALYNTTDDSSCQITSADATTIGCTAGLAGGTDNDWDNGDIAAVIQSGVVNQSTGTSTRTLFVEYEAENLTFARSPADYMRYDGYGNLSLVKNSGSDDAIQVTTYKSAYDNYIEADGDIKFDYVTVDEFMNLPANHVTVSGGVLTITNSRVLVSCEGLVNDDLNTINGGIGSGDILILCTYGDGGTLTLKDGVDNLQLEGDFAMNSTRDQILLLWNAVNWVEVGRSNNN